MALAGRPSQCVAALRMAGFVAALLVSALLARSASIAADDKTPPQAVKSGKEAAGKSQVPFTISKKTTFLLAPLDQDGCVDYVAALNQTLSEGVTPENNAGVLLVRAFGVNEFEHDERARFFKLLGIEPLPEPSSSVVAFTAFVANKLGRALTQKESDDFERAMKEPWSPEGFPLLAGWVNANEPTLRLVIEATHRTRCYLPLVVPAGTQIAEVRFPCTDGCRNAARLLAVRAMREIGRGQIASAEEDLLTCHRLARLYGRTPFLLPALVAYAIDATACVGDVQLMNRAQYAKRSLAYQQELRQLAPLPSMAIAIGEERFMFLEGVVALAREKMAPGDALGLFTADPPKGFEQALAHRSAIDWDEALIFGNEQFDKVVAAFSRSTAGDRKAAFAELDQAMHRLSKEMSSDAFRSWLQPGARKNLGRTMGKVLTVTLLPAFEAAFQAENRAHSRETLGQLGFSLAAYSADHSAYPDSLDALAPKYIGRVQNDPCTDQPMHYRREGAGCVLYSVGANGVDDGGRTFDSKPAGDDIVLRLGGPSRSKQ
ncbi:MAG TPA: hypothetical protein VGP76_29570 [Planctomycetaceae bacterium]|nr:hypothetical protein [Planctomycetaceae bacterium]